MAAGGEGGCACLSRYFMASTPLFQSTLHMMRRSRIRRLRSNKARHEAQHAGGVPKFLKLGSIDNSNPCRPREHHKPLVAAVGLSFTLSYMLEMPSTLG